MKITALRLVVFAVPRLAFSAGCTPGTDRYCDKVKNPASPFYDPNLLALEDFEAPTMRANTNQSGYTPSTQLTFRYEDNVHIRAGMPVSCSQIGFGAGASAPQLPPAKPSGLRLQ